MKSAGIALSYMIFAVTIFLINLINLLWNLAALHNPTVPALWLMLNNLNSWKIVVLAATTILALAIAFSELHRRNQTGATSWSIFLNMMGICFIGLLPAICIALSDGRGENGNSILLFIIYMACLLFYVLLALFSFASRIPVYGRS